MNAALLAKALGGDVIGRNKVLAPGPGHSRNDRSLSVILSPSAPDGFCVFSFADDSIPDCREHVKAVLGIGWQITRHTERVWKKAHRPDVPPSLYWKRIWDEAGQISGTVAERYLQSRMLSVSPELSGALRFHPSLKYNGRIVPGMVGLFRDIISNEPVGIHRLFLTASGEKIGRKMLGRARGAAIKLDADEHITGGLSGGEGVETCLAARLAGFRPCWALGSSGGIENFPVLAGIEALNLLAETDDKGANARAVQLCAERWADAGREVGIVEPIGSGDMNSVWKAAQ